MKNKKTGDEPETTEAVLVDAVQYLLERAAIASPRDAKAKDLAARLTTASKTEE